MSTGFGVTCKILTVDAHDVTGATATSGFIYETAADCKTRKITLKNWWERKGKYQIPHAEYRVCVGLGKDSEDEEMLFCG